MTYKNSHNYYNRCRHSTDQKYMAQNQDMTCQGSKNYTDILHSNNNNNNNYKADKTIIIVQPDP